MVQFFFSYFMTFAALSKPTPKQAAILVFFFSPIYCIPAKPAVSYNKLPDYLFNFPVAQNPRRRGRSRVCVVRPSAPLLASRRLSPPRVLATSTSLDQDVPHVHLNASDSLVSLTKCRIRGL